MFDKLIFILAALTVLVFLVTVLYRGNTAQTCLLFVLFMLPVMNLKITQESWGGFKTFDFICFFSLLFLLKEFITVDLLNRQRFYLVLFGSLMIIMLLGGLASEFPAGTWLSLVKTVPIFIFARFLILECFRDASFHASVIRTVKASFVMALAFLFVQTALGLRFTFYPGLAPNTIDPVFHMVRFPGIFYDSQAHGQFLAMGSFLFLSAGKNSTRNSRLIGYGIFLLAIIAMILAGSRAAIGGFCAGMLVLLFMAAPKYRVYGALAIAIGSGLYLLISPSSGVFERAENLSEDYLFRQSIWKEAFDISKKHPLLGIGAGNYQDYVIRHNQNQYLEIEDGQLVYFDQPENGYLKIMVELGFIGFGIFILFILTPLVTALLAFIRRQASFGIIVLAAALISWIIAFNTVYSIYDYRILIMVTTLICLMITFPTEKPVQKPTRHGN